MCVLAIIPLASVGLLGSCDQNNAVDAFDAKLEQEKKIAAERREKDDPTVFATGPPVGVKLGAELE